MIRIAENGFYIIPVPFRMIQGKRMVLAVGDSIPVKQK
jgi:hypothetical protein